MSVDPDKSTKKLLSFLLMSDLENIYNLLKNTEAESLVSEKIEKTAISIKSVLATYLNVQQWPHLTIERTVPLSVWM